MGRPKRKRPTVHARMYKEDYDELRFKFPNQTISDLINIAYRTSPLKLEAALRNPKKKKNELF